jgi:hypothetical protein
LYTHPAKFYIISAIYEYINILHVIGVFLFVCQITDFYGKIIFLVNTQPQAHDAYWSVDVPVIVPPPVLPVIPPVPPVIPPVPPVIPPVPPVIPPVPPVIPPVPPVIPPVPQFRFRLGSTLLHFRYSLIHTVHNDIFSLKIYKF